MEKTKEVFDRKMFQNLVEKSPDGIVVIGEGRKVVYVNATISRMLGYKKNEVIGKDPVKFVSKEMRKKVSDAYKKRLRGQKVPRRSEVKLLRKDGKEVYVEVNASVYKFKNKVFDFVIIRDITERKITEEKLKKSEERFRSLVESTNDAIINIDAKGRIVFWNKGAEKIFGYSSKEIIGKPLTVVMPKKFHKSYKKGLRKTITTGKSKILGKTKEYPIVRKDGTEVLTEMNFSSWKIKDKTYFTAIIRDISERKKVEQRFRSLFELAGDPIVILDKAGRFIEVNKKAEELLGYKKEELIGKKFTQNKLLTRKSKIIAFKNFLKRMAGFEIKPYEIEVVKKNGEKIIGEINAASLKEDGRIIGDIVIIREVTERKKMEEELKKRNEELEKMRKLFIGRELKMKELKEKIKKLEEEIKLLKGR